MAPSVRPNNRAVNHLAQLTRVPVAMRKSFCCFFSKKKCFLPFHDTYMTVRRPGMQRPHVSVKRCDAISLAGAAVIKASPFPHAAPRALRPALLRGVSLTAMVVAGAVTPARAGGGSFKTLSQALASHPSAAVAAAATAGGAQAAQQAGLGAQNFSDAAARFRTLQQALANQTYGGPQIPNGVQPGGLQQADGVAGSNNSTLWSGASTTLAQSASGGTTTVTVDQTGSVAALTWKSFNVGAHTKLVFNQSAGGTLASSWVAINTVADPAAMPSTILGDISAPGKVYILDANGILFGTGSQINVGGLIATTAVIAQAQFTTGTNGLISGFSLYGTPTGVTNKDSFTPTFLSAIPGALIDVEPGAVISTPVPTGTSGGGYVMLLAAAVENGGAITTPQGQTVLAAGNDFILQAGYSLSNPVATVVGSEVAVNINDTITGSGATALGSATNTGLIIADQGDITMVGHAVTQAGVLLATTTVDERGTVHLLTDDSNTNGNGGFAADTTASVVLAPGSVTEILPENIYSYQGSLVTPLENANASLGTLQTALDAQRASNLSSSVTYNTLRTLQTGPLLNDFDNLPDTLGESRVEISTAGTVDVQGSALVLAQGGQVAVNAGSQITLETGATIDVSGTNAALPASANVLDVAGIVGSDLRDSAANRDAGSLEFGTIYADIQSLVEISSGAYAGNVYTQGGLLEVSGLLGLIGHGINEWSSIGGQVTLQSGDVVFASGDPNPIKTAGTITLSAGSTINLTGGTVTYDAGLVQQSYVQSTDGRIFNINNAPGDLVYTGVYDGAQETHARWHITQTYVNPLLTPMEVAEPQYTIGRDAGNLTISAGNVVLDGTLAAGVTVGANQTSARPANVTDPFLLVQAVVPLAGSLAVAAYSGGTLQTAQFTSTVVIGDVGRDDLPPQTPQPQSGTETATGTISLDTGALNNGGFSNVTVFTGGILTVADTLTLADGSTLTLGGGIVSVNAGITAHDGKVNLTNLLAPNQALSSAGGITVAAGVAIDTSGEWTNLQADPANHALAGYANGGNVTIDSIEAVDLAAGSLIDVSSGGVLSATGKLMAATGGSVSISADIYQDNIYYCKNCDDVTLAGTIEGFASSTAGNGAGTLSIEVPNISLGTTPTHFVPIDPNAVLTLPGNALFEGGFADYVLNGYVDLEVTSGTTLAVTRPVYQLTNLAVPTGSPSAAAYSVVLPPLYTPNYATDTITQRAGASLALESTIDPGAYNGQGGAVFIDAAASVAVDPGSKQSITVEAYGQLTDLGTLTAHGGAITLANDRYDNESSGGSRSLPSNYVPGLSVWIGDGAVVDASGQAITFANPAGGVFGSSQAGGTILLGGLGGTSVASLESTYAQIIERPGALLNASGAAATVTVVPTITSGKLVHFSAPLTLAGNGGTVIARSYDGIAFDGALLAGGAGPGAAGGTLVMRLDPQAFLSFDNLPAAYEAASRILISQYEIQVQTTPGLTPGETTNPDTEMLGRISAQQLAEGGFDSIDLYAQDYIAFDGGVSLTLGRSATLEAPFLGETMKSANVSLSAPYIDLVGYDPATNPVLPNVSLPDTLLPPSAALGTLHLNAGLIDESGALDLGGIEDIVESQQGGTLYALAYGFAAADFTSTGDIRFDLSAGNVQTVLASSNNITFQAAQIYPASDANAEVIAGYNLYVSNSDTITNEFAGGTIAVLGQPGTAPASPYSIDGTLALVTETIIQDGVLRAPEGTLTLGSTNPNGREFTNSVVLGPESITSVSLFGQTVPYGGTVDGVNYDYPNPTMGTSTAVGSFAPTVEVYSAQLAAAPGSQIDLRGGGTLAGAGFIPGRGGSADVNLTPLLNSGSGTVAINTSSPDQVFAIVVGYGASYAPVTPGDSYVSTSGSQVTYSQPGIGEQITIGAGEVAGLPAGTYTLLPAYYDLLPGGYRVELTPGAAAPGQSEPFGNFTTAAAVQVGYANTSILSPVPQAALITSGAGVRQLSQYDEESYNTFEATATTAFGSARPQIPQDAGTLEINLNSLAGTAGVAAVPIDIPTDSLLKAPGTFSVNGTASVGNGATIEIDSQGLPLVVFGASNEGLASIDVSSAAIDALTQPVTVTQAGGTAVNVGTRLVLGGTLTSSEGTIFVSGVTSDVVLLNQADVTAADVILVAGSNGLIQLDPGVTASTAGQGVVLDGNTAFPPLTTQSETPAPILALSNNNLQFQPNPTSAAAAIVVDQGVTLQTATGGSLNFDAPPGTSVAVAQANLAASYVYLQVANINIGTGPTLANFAAVLPAGLTLTAAALNTLAQNATVLSLSADQAFNVLGDVTLSSGTDLVLNTPVIYGYGISGSGGSGAQTGSVTITAPNLTWGGVQAADPLQNQSTAAVSATPGGALSGSAGGLTLTTGGAQSALTIDAAGTTLAPGTLTLGYGPNVTVNDQVMLDRLAAGFANVTLAASGEITANNQSALTVLQVPGTQGQTGQAGNLALQTPLLTAASGAVLQITAGGSLAVTSLGTLAPASTGTVSTLGAEIDLTGAQVTTSTSIALPSGALSITADGTLSNLGTTTLAPTSSTVYSNNGSFGSSTVVTDTTAQAVTGTITGALIDLLPGTTIDLSGRQTPIFDQTASSRGGTLLLQSASGIDTQTTTVTSITTTLYTNPNGLRHAPPTITTTTGTSTTLSTQPGDSLAGTSTNNITIAGASGGGAAAVSDGSAAGAPAGLISASALDGTVSINGVLQGASSVNGGSFNLIAGTLGAGFDALNTLLDTGGFTGARAFEFATGNIAVDQTIAAHIIDIAADSGNIDVSASIDASGSTPGTILLAAGGTLTLAGTAVIDAQSSQTRQNSYGNDVDAENRAEVTLTSTGGSILLDQGATIDVGYPDDASNPQGQVVINAPRITAPGGALIDVAVSATGSLNIIGARSIDLFALQTYTPTDPNGTIVQDNGNGSNNTTPTNAGGTLGLNQISNANSAYMAQVGTDGATLAAGQLRGLAAYGADFNLAPGLLITSSAASGGNLTISGDLDFSSLRYSDPSQFGTAITAGIAGSGEAGAILFRATNNLTINGSVTDGFLAPPDESQPTLVATSSADTSGWTIYDSFSRGVPWVDPTNSDLLLPSSAYGTYNANGTLSDSSQLVLLGSSTGGFATVFETNRPISLNYAIEIQSTYLKTDVVIPFAVTVGYASDPIPAGGWVATSNVYSGSGTLLFAKGALIPQGYSFQPGDLIAAGAVMPVVITTANDQVIPAGTSFDVFSTTAPLNGGNGASPGTIALAMDTPPLPAGALIPSFTRAYFGVQADVDGVDRVTPTDTVYLRGTLANGVQGYLYPLAQMLPAGSQSWSMDFVAGANASAADANAVQPLTALDGGALAPAYAPTNANTNAAAGSLLIDDQHYFSYTRSDADSSSFSLALTAFSVIRTGTGDLSLSAGGDIDQSSLYGIYTAGTQDPLGSGQDAQFDQPRQALGQDGKLLPEYATNPLHPGNLNVAANMTDNYLISEYQANYPNDGGDVQVSAQGNVTSDIYGGSGYNGFGGTVAPASDVVGNWLFRQGGTGTGQPTAWWINFGTLVDPLYSTGIPQATVSPASIPLAMTGFVGIGALGGGNVSVNIGGNAGQTTARDDGGGIGFVAGEGLVIAVGSTGRLLSGSADPITTGGGNITVTVGGTLNPLDAQAYRTDGDPQDVNGDLIDISGNINVNAGAIGRIDYIYNSGSANLFDPRATNPATPNDGFPADGIIVVPGDGTVDITTDRDLVLGGAGDPGRIAEQSLTSDGTGVANGTTYALGDFAGFTLWQPTTSISLFSAGGNVTPTSVPNEGTSVLLTTPSNDLPTDFRSEYPPTLLVTAATGDIIYGADGFNPSTLGGTLSNSSFDNYALETMPSPTGQVEFLAGRSIFANGYVVDMSGANPANLSSIADPAFQALGIFTTRDGGQDNNIIYTSNVLTLPQQDLTPLALFALAADTPTNDVHQNDPNPARFYAANGDIVNFQTGETLDFIQGDSLIATWYIAAKPVWIEASEDIVSTGTRPSDYPNQDPLLFSVQENFDAAPNFGANSGTVTILASGDLFLNNNAAEISVIAAGRDILSPYAYVIGPGLLEVDAARNLNEAGFTLEEGGTQQQELSFGQLRSLGDNYLPGSPPDTADGAGIAVLAGTGSAGPDTTAFANLYFNPANQANLSLPITDPSNKGKVQQVYTSQLVTWLQQNYAYTGDAGGALAWFLANVPALDQAVFVRAVFFDELSASGAQESDPNSRFYKDYIRGQQAIDTLFPSNTTTLGVPTGYAGGITAYSGTLTLADAGNPTPLTVDGGIATLFGGGVQILDPGGNVEFGIPGGPPPGNESGIITYGSGDIDIYALDSVELGKSRIFTTGGGNITIWSSSGNIDAGLGAKTTISYTPPSLDYDVVGDVTEAPPDSTSGAGIASLQPLPSVPPGDVNLIAPEGAIDAGEAGIRVSGNLVLAGQRVIGAANITVKGSTQGAPTVNVASLGAVEAAGAAAGASTSAAQSQGPRGQTSDVASVLDVEVVSIGGSYEDDRKKKKRAGM
jgi:filamentous hemagglutinin family protein